MTNEFLLIIDGSSLLSTQYYGNLPREIMFAKTEEERENYYYKIMQTSTGIYTNGIYGFMRTLLKIIREQKPTHVAVTWDISRNTFRREIDSEYKGTRGATPKPLKEQFVLCQEILKEMNIPQFMDEKYEADDFSGTLSNKFENELPIKILTKDNDYLQLVTDKTNLWLMYTTQDKADDLYKKYKINKLESNFPDKSFQYTPDLVKKEFGINPCQVPDLKSLVGDKSDNIKGVSGVGEASAVPLIAYYGTVEKLYDAIRNLDKKSEKEIKEEWKNNLGIKRSPLSYLLKTSDTEIVGEESAKISKKLAKIKCDIDLGDLSLKDLSLNIDLDKGNSAFHKLEFKSLSLDEVGKDNKDNINSNVEIEEVNTFEEMKKAINEEKDISFISYSTINSSLFSSIDLDKIYIGKNHKIINININEIMNNNKEDVIDLLKDFMENNKIKKVIHDSKALITILSKYNIEIKGLIFDTAIAGYLIDSSKGSYELKDLIYEYLSIKGEENILPSYMEKLYIKLMEIIKDNEMEDLYYNVELPLVFVLSSMEQYGFNIDKNELENQEIKFKEEIEKTQKEIYTLAEEEFNINSPKQLGKILFEKLDLPVIKKTKTGYSTNVEVLEKLLGKHPIIDKIIYYRQITKLNSTYIEGLKNVIDEDGHIHSSFNQTVTTTGRLSSTEPNLQNIPIKYEMGREIRKIFIPEEKGDIILSCDYSQIELRVLAHMSNDENMINSFIHHSDIHRKTASEVFNVPVNEVTSIMRSRAKAVNFGIVYGISAFSLAKDLNISRKEAEEYMNIYFERYPMIKSYLEKVINDTREKGYVLTILNRRRFIPELNSTNKIVMALGERLAMNAPIQGSAADIIKIAMVNVFNRIKREKLKSKLILQVHDELILNVKSDEVEKVSDIVKEEMEGAIKLHVPLDVDLNKGTTWYEAK